MIGKKKATVVGVIGGILMVAALIMIAGPTETLNALKSAKIQYILLAFLVQMFISVLYPLRWKVLLETVTKKVSFFHIYLISSFGYLVNILTPGAQAGGEPARAYVLSKVEKLPSSRCFASIVVERFYDVISYLLFILIGLIMLFRIYTPGVLGTVFILGGIFIIVFLTVIAIYVSVDRRISLKLLRRIFRILRNIKPLVNKVDEWAARAENTVEEYSRSFRRILSKNIKKNIAYSLAIRTLEILRLYIILHAFGLLFGIDKVVVIFSIIVLSMLVPSPPAGLGVVESAYLLIFKLLGVKLSTAAAIMIVDRFISSAIPAFIGAVCGYYLGFRLMNNKLLIEKGISKQTNCKV